MPQCDFPWLNRVTCLAKVGGGSIAQSPTSSPSQTRTLRPTNAPQEPIVYYPDLTLGVCKSDGLQPPSLSATYLFTSPEMCCYQNFIVSSEKCMAYTRTYRVDITNMDTSNCYWYPNPHNFGTCTFSEQYPQTWTSDSQSRNALLHGTHDQCCTTVFGGTDNCHQEYNCNGEKGGPTPTGYVSAPPTTYYPTWNPTREDEGIVNVRNQPTPRVTPSPVISQGNDDAPISIVDGNVLDVTSITSEVKDSFEDAIGSLSATWPWKTTSSNPWTIQANDKTDGSYSVWSHPNLQSGESSDLSLTITSTHGGTLHFDFKSDVSMPYSGCYININDESKVGYTYATPGWIEDMMLDIEGGKHTVTFRAWVPNLLAGVDGGDDAGGVSGTVGLDNVRFIPNLE